MFLTQPPFWSRSMLCCVLISGERLPDQSIRVVSARSQHLVFKWNFWCFDLSMRLLVMTSHGSVSITSFDRLKMFPHPVTVKATALTDVGLGALSTCQLVAEVLPHAINTFTQIAFPDMGITFSRFKFSGG